MKRLSIIITLLFLATTMFAQKREVVSAFNYLKHEKLEKAKEAIDNATVHEKTKDEAKTWFYRGNIYLQLATTENEDYQNLAENPLQEAYQSYQKAMELDEKDEYTLDILQNLRFIAQEYYNRGASYYGKDYISSANAFMQSYKVSQEVGRTDTVAMLNYSLAASQGGLIDSALVKLEKLIEWEFEDPAVYETAGTIYLQKDQIDKAEEAITMGREKFPENYPLLLSEINIYMSTQQSEKAVSALEQAVEQDSANHTIWRALGDMYDKMAKDTTISAEQEENYMEKAANAYNKAIDIKPDYFEAYYNLGALYVNKAAEIQQEASDVPLNQTERYNELKAKADSMLKKAIDPLEGALEVDPTDRNTLYSLKQIYTMLGQMEKANEINARIQEQE